MLLLTEDSALFKTLRNLLDHKKRVFLVGLPGTGKSLLLQQLAILGRESGRKPHLLQWDVCRLPFLKNPQVLQRYPEKNGATHAVVRKAAGIWAREAVLRWSEKHKDDQDMLIGEIPVVGNRLVELVRKEADSAESWLADAASSFFGIPTPSREIRQIIETQRKERSANPLHERERGDAQPDIMYALWEELCDVGAQRGLLDDGSIQNRAGSYDSDRQGLSRPYDPEVYFKSYATLLKHRPSGRIHLNEPLATEGRSVYNFAVGQQDMVPSEEEVQAAIETVEQKYPDLEELEKTVENWHDI